MPRRLYNREIAHFLPLNVLALIHKAEKRPTEIQKLLKKLSRLHEKELVSYHTYLFGCAAIQGYEQEGFDAAEMNPLGKSFT